MKPRELLLSALRREETPRVPWVPFAGVHAGSLVNADATKLLTSEDALVEALLAVNRLYRPDGQPVLFDLQLEAEILGCGLRWSANSPPSVVSHPLAGGLSAPDEAALPGKEDGRLPLALGAMRRMKEAVGSETALFGLVCGPFTLASHLRGSDLFMDMYDDPDGVRRLLRFCAACARRLAGYYLDAGMDVIAMVDPMVSQISSAHFRHFLLEPFAELFRFVREQGALSSFFVCGDATRNIRDMCLTAPDAIFVDENVSLPDAKRLADRHGVAMGGNIPLTTVMLHGTQADNMKAVTDLVDGVDSLRGLVIAPGCDMPYDVPPENAIGVSQAVREPEKVRELLRHYISAAEELPVELPDYAALPRPLVEVFTLDSDTCAACAYMLEAAVQAKLRFGAAVDLADYKSTTRENIARARKLGVKKLPSIYLSGELKFASLIPSREELDAEIRKLL